MNHIKTHLKPTRPVRVIQFGGGVFLRLGPLPEAAVHPAQGQERRHRKYDEHRHYDLQQVGTGTPFHPELFPLLLHGGHSPFSAYPSDVRSILFYSILVQMQHIFSTF
jgi:hypothetical protein